ncbi:hypothetical protein D1872_347960 [compost metagenome]
MIDEDVVLHIHQFLLNRNRLADVADGILKQGNQCIDRLGGRLLIAALYQHLDRGKRIIEEMRINLTL